MTKPGRKPNPTPSEADTTFELANVDSLNKADHVLQALDAKVHASSELYMAIGRLQTGLFYDAVSSKVIATEYVNARDLLGKLGSVTLFDPRGSAKQISSLDELCQFKFGVSARRCQQIVANQALVGEVLFEASLRMGFRQRDYQALRALPEPEQDTVKAAIASGDKEQVFDLLAELAARNEALRQQADEHSQVLKAKDKVIAKRDQKIAQYAEAEERRNSNEATAQLERLREVTLAAELTIAQLQVALIDVRRDAGSEAVELASQHAMAYVCQALADAAANCGITVDLAERVQPLDVDAYRKAAEASPKAGRKG